MNLELEIEDLADRLFNEKKDVLFIDTCILLNVVRCLDIDRQHLSDYTSAKEIIFKLNEGTLTYNLVTLSPTNSEWNRNIVNVCTEAKAILNKSYQIIERATKILNNEDSTKNSFIKDLRGDSIEEKVKIVSQTLLENSYICKSRDDIKVKATNRVISDKLPARKANNSLNDCIIFEEVLEIASILRKKNFTRKMVFSTSNIKDFGKAEDRDSSINKELSAFQIQYVTNLEWANSVLTKI